MIELDIQLRYDPKFVQTDTQFHWLGCFVESADAYLWLDVATRITNQPELCEIFSWSVQGEVAGVFIRTKVSGSSQILHNKILHHERVLFFQLVDQSDEKSDVQFWIPLDGLLSPVPKDHEWPSILSGKPKLMVWHPGTGLLVWQPDQGGTFDKIIIAPRSLSVSWNQAVPGTILAERLLKIDVPEPPSLEQWLAESGKDIGIAKKDIAKLPPTNSERRGQPLGNAVSIAKSGIGQTVGWFADQVEETLRQGKKLIGSAFPKSASSLKPHGNKSNNSHATVPKALPGHQWIANMRAWAGQQMKQWNQTLEARREASVNRLMEMLDKDPEQGLRYAIPLSSGDAGRGLASPGSDLVSRQFGLGNSPSGAADPWTLDWKVQQKLRAKYTELAQQELRAGRYERAASIYIHLLSDYQQAAQALEQGRLYRQASKIYEERLNNLSKAAEMHVLAGDFEVAIELYSKLRDFLKVGELYRKMELHEEATSAFRKHIEMLASTGRWCDAADVFLDKLDAVDEALELLQSHWPIGISASSCADKTFSILRERKLDGKTLSQIQRLVDNASTPACGAWPVELLARLANDYPDQKVREESAKSVFVLASLALKGLADMSAVGRITDALSRSLPTDNLLARDTRRYTQEEIAKRNRSKHQAKYQAPPTRTLSRPVSSVSPLNVECDFSLSDQVHWFGLIPIDEGLLCLGQRDSDLVIYRLSTQSEHHLAKEASEQRTLEKVCKAFFTTSESPRWVRHVRRSQDGIESIQMVIGGDGNGEEIAFAKLPEFGITIRGMNRNCLDCCLDSNQGNNTIGLQTKGARELGFILSVKGSQVVLGALSEDGSTRYPSQDQSERFRNFEQKAREMVMERFHLLDSLAPEFAAEEMLKHRWRIARLGASLVLSWGQQVSLFHEDQWVHGYEAASPVKSIRVSDPWSRPRAILGLETGIVVKYLRASDEFRTVVVDREVRNAQGCFLPSGHLFVAHDAGVQIYSFKGEHAILDRVYHREKSHSTIVAIEFKEQSVWTLTEDGRLQQWPIVQQYKSLPNST